MKILTGACGAVLALSCGLASAQSTEDAYVGASLGLGHVGIQCGDTTSCDATHVGEKAFIGAHFTEKLSIEMNYIVFGKADATATNGATIDYEVKAFAVNLAYRWNLAPKWSLIGRGGIANVMTQGSTPTGADAADSSSSLYLGLSAGYEIAPNLRAEAGLDLTKAKLDGHSRSAKLFSAGVTYGF